MNVDRHSLKVAVLAAFLMCVAALSAHFMTPTVKLAALNPISLESIVPKAFGDWVLDARQVAGVVSPERELLIKRLYSQTLSRTYVNKKTGERIMLSIAYGEDQRDGMQLHYPEVCYPAQGFDLHSNRKGTLTVAGKEVPVRRLETSLSKQRYEPVTYWTIVGDQVVFGGIGKKVAEMRYGLRGLVADGLLFRVSSIDTNATRGFDLQARFVDDLFKSLPPTAKARLAAI